MLQLADSASVKSTLKLRRMLAHFDAFRPECVHPLNGEDPDTLIRRICSAKVPATEWDILSEDPALDGRSMALHEIAQAAIGSGFATLAAPRGAKLAFFQGEEQHSAIMLTVKD